jgi:hypothetical protein
VAGAEFAVAACTPLAGAELLALGFGASGAGGATGAAGAAAGAGAASPVVQPPQAGAAHAVPHPPQRWRRQHPAKASDSIAHIAAAANNKTAIPNFLFITHPP